MSKTIRVRVPATTSNLGPGFDALGLALARYNTVIAEPSSALEVVIVGEGARDLPRDASNLLVRSAEAACKAAGVALPTMRYVCEHAIPPARGLGSSGAAVVAGLLVGDAVSGGTLGRDGVLALASRIEGHPDNAAPAVFGGLQVAVLAGDGSVHRAAAPVADFPRVALFIPDFQMPTHQARALLPEVLPRADAVFNLSRASLLIAALCSGRDDVLAVATEDVIHQRPREAIFPAMPALFRAAMSAGALGVWLSGAGSTVAAFARPDRAQHAAEAMAAAARDAGLAGYATVLSVDRSGASCEVA